MAKNQWFNKFVGCTFFVEVQGTMEEYIFCGTYENPARASGYPLQYEFEAEGKPNLILGYKDARAVMGAMIEKYSHEKRA